MAELPMLAFRFNCNDGLIELFIDEVFGFPNETSYGGGYGAKGMLSIRSGAYSVEAAHYFTTGELYQFAEDLSRCYKNLSGEVTLNNIESELELHCVFNKLGHVKVSGQFQANPASNNILIFDVNTDQTQINDAIIQLKEVSKHFGDNCGIRTK